MSRHEGGCLCRAIRYTVTANPVRVTICHCTFCQAATGSVGMVEPIFNKGDLKLLAGTVSTFDMPSRGSGKRITINFCKTCGTKIFLAFERFSEVYGLYAGTFDDPNWFDRSPANTKYIFTGVAQKGTILPPGYDTFVEHAWLSDGSPVEPSVFNYPHIIEP